MQLQDVLVGAQLASNPLVKQRPHAAHASPETLVTREASLQSVTRDIAVVQEWLAGSG